VLLIDGQYTQSAFGPAELSVGCHIVVSVRLANRSSRFGKTAYFRFTAKASHRYVIERKREYNSKILGSGRYGSQVQFTEVRSLAELDERGALERRYLELEASGTPQGC
jgi:hypothetical protein